MTEAITLLSADPEQAKACLSTAIIQQHTHLDDIDTRGAQLLDLLTASLSEETRILHEGCGAAIQALSNLPNGQDMIRQAIGSQCHEFLETHAARVHKACMLL